MKTSNHGLGSGAVGGRTTRRLLTAAVMIALLLAAAAVAAECTWPGQDDIVNPVTEPQPGDTVTCSGATPGGFGAGTAMLTVNVLPGASAGFVVLSGGNSAINNFGTIVDGAELGGADSVFENFGWISSVSLVGPGYTAGNFGEVVNDDAAAELAPRGAIAAAVQEADPGQIVNGATLDGIGSITTSGDSLAGILVRDPNGTIEIRNDARATPGGQVARASITTSGAGSPGIYLVDDEDPFTGLGSVLNTISNGGTIATSGDESPGIQHWPLFGSLPASGTTRIRNLATGSIVTGGDDAPGIRSWGFDVDVTNGGNILTRGFLSSGIEVLGLDDVSVLNEEDGTITTEGARFAPGISVQRIRPAADLEVDNAGDIVTGGDDSPGIVTAGAGVAIGNRQFATITTAGASSNGMQLGTIEPALGIDAPSSGGTATNAGIIGTSGEFASGLRAFGSDNELLNEENGIITTTAQAAMAIGMSGTGTMTNAGHIVTGGLAAVGIFGTGTDLTAVNSGDITTTGDGGRGIWITSDTARVHADGFSDIETGGGAAHGIDVGGADAGVRNEGTIVTTGAGSYGIRFDAVDGFVDQEGTVTTGGIGAFGIGAASELAGSGDAVRIDNAGNIATTGEDADGINAVNGFFSIINNGGISTSGAAADGIETSGKPIFSFAPVNSVINNGEIFVSDPASAGVRLATQGGEDATFTNAVGGVVTSAVYAVVGGEGSEAVRNDGRLNGSVDLGASDDQFIRGSGSIVTGEVNGGTDSGSLFGDTLTLEFEGLETVTGSQFINFEKLTFFGIGRLLLLDNLRIDDITLLRGFVDLQALARLFGNVSVESGATLGGSGSVGGNLGIAGGAAAPGESIGTLFVDGDFSLDGGRLLLEADSLLDRDILAVAGAVSLVDGVLDVVLGFTPAPTDVLEFFDVAGSFTIGAEFDGVRGFAAQGSGVPIGTPFSVDLGGQLVAGTVAAVIPLPPALPLLAGAMAALCGLRRRPARGQAGSELAR